MCDSIKRLEFGRNVRDYVVRHGIKCEVIAETPRRGFWVTDPRWVRADKGKIGFATACSDERLAALQKPHRMSACLHLAPEFEMELARQVKVLTAMEQWHNSPPGYVHYWFADENGQELRFEIAPFTEEFGDLVVRMLWLIGPAR